MRIAHIDASAGVSGDMLLGAALDAGASLEVINDAVSSLGVGDVRITVARVRRAGITATKIRVRAPEETPEVRTWRQIREILTFVALDDDVRDRVLATFQRLAEAEAVVHNEKPEDVHFHEIGALDTLADVVGVVAALHDLQVTRLTCGPIGIGTGTVETAHGELPLPVPAVSQLLVGRELRGRAIDAELVTPTGAALVATLSEPVAAMPPMRLASTGVGAGDRDLPHPNVVRLFVGDPARAERHASTAVVLEATVDDLTPELVPVVLDRLRGAGAHDAWATPVLMKKGRPGYTLSCLCDPEAVDVLRAVLYRESSTIGSRAYTVSKDALPRESLTVYVDGEPIGVKVARLDGAVVSAAPEFDDVGAAADRLGRPARDVHQAAEAAARRALGQNGT